MGEGTNGVRPSPEELERDVERIRDSMAGIVSELDRRRHELFDWRLQLRRHKLGIGLLAGGVVLLLGTAMVVKNSGETWNARVFVPAGLESSVHTLV